MRRTGKAAKTRVLYLSSPIGLGHARRDLAVTRELAQLCPDLQVDWLAQDPVTRFLTANDQHVHPASRMLANESEHIEAESGEHDLNAFQAIRSMDEILIKNFMVFQEVLEEEAYDLVIADEAWEVDHYWHEHPELKRAQIAWLTDFVGWVPFAENGPREAFLTTDYNAEMIGHVENNPTVRDRAIFVGGAADIVDLSFGTGLPKMRDWIPKHYEFSDYIIGRHPSEFGSREDLRAESGGGVKRGCVYGKSDASGMYPDERPVKPEDLAATLYYLMGIDPASEIRDRNDRPLAIAGRPVLDVVA
jgi:hypothetical protein